MVQLAHRATLCDAVLATVTNSEIKTQLMALTRKPVTEVCAHRSITTLPTVSNPKGSRADTDNETDSESICTLSSGGSSDDEDIDEDTYEY